MRKGELGSYLTSDIKINSKWAKDGNLRPETIKILEETERKLPNIGLGGDCMNMTSKVSETEAKIDSESINQSMN